MHVLVTAASKHGATAEIARAIGDELERRKIHVTVAPITGAGTIDGYDAVIAGSAVYAGQWLKPAKDFLERNAAALVARPVWLFSSGPIGDPPRPEEEPPDAPAMVASTGAREHRTFAGKIDRDRLSLAERAIVMALRAPSGDFRDWDEIRDWSSAIAAELQQGAA
jgi:menaquinone-dependent protoporphyrinogen oxidase